MERKFKVLKDDYLDHCSKSDTLTQGIIKAKKCQIKVNKGTYDYNVVIEGINGDKVGYEFNTTGPVAQAIIDFFCDEASKYEHYEVLQNSIKYNVKCYPSGKEIATVDINDEEEFEKNRPDWLGEEIKE